MSLPHFSYIHKVTSIEKQRQIFDMLLHFNPTHDERLWLVGFLKFVGYTQEGVCEIIHQHCEWNDYDPRTTAYQVSTVFRQAPRTSSGSQPTRRARKWDLSPLQVYRLNCVRTTEMNRRITAELRRLGLPVYESPHGRGMPFRPETLLRNGL